MDLKSIHFKKIKACGYSMDHLEGLGLKVAQFNCTAPPNPMCTNRVTTTDLESKSWPSLFFLVCVAAMMLLNIIFCHWLSVQTQTSSHLGWVV